MDFTTFPRLGGNAATARAAASICRIVPFLMVRPTLPGDVTVDLNFCHNPRNSLIAMWIIARPCPRKAIPDGHLEHFIKRDGNKGELMDLSTWLTFERTGRVTPGLIQGLLHDATISYREHKPDRQLPRPSLQGHALGLGLDSFERRTIAEFQGAKMTGCDGAYSGQDGKDSGEIGVAMGMQCQCLHGPTLPDRMTSARAK